MPLKSWAFVHDGHPIRAEIWWRFSGWSRKRLYIGHRCVDARQDWFSCGSPLHGGTGDAARVKQTVGVRFRPRRLFFDMDCHCNIDFKPIVWPETELQVERKGQHSASSEGMSGVVYDNRALGCLVLLPLLVVLAIVSGPLIAVGGVLAVVWERRLAARMRRRNRSLSWPQVEERMLRADAPSTLIVEAGFQTDWRAWWSEDDLLANAPLPIPDATEMIEAGGRKHPFVEWCWHQYLSEAAGKAYLTELPETVRKRLKFFDERHDAACCRPLYPMLNVIITGYARGKRAKAAPVFSGMLRETLAQSVPDLIAGLEHQDAAIREMSREAIALAGPAAAGDAVPALARQLYVCPWEDRYGVADALASLGPAGMDVLATAAGLGDPCLKGPARSAIQIRALREKRRDRG